ncbi:MAG: hypothetical protein NT045_02970 [Candidatus Aureabacteria bacterium]|nr:hypothetical protein [Candidatus Auribacterota bacterium]
MDDIRAISLTYMALSALLGIALGVLMLQYPGGTECLMESSLQIFQAVLTVFILCYSLSEATRYIRMGYRWGGGAYILLGIGASVLVWVFTLQMLYIMIAIFLMLAALGEIIGSLRAIGKSYFLTFLGVVNIVIAFYILRYPIIFQYLVAWYVLFWGVSRMFFYFELKRILAR